MSFNHKREFPAVRMRRRRQAKWALDLFAETSLLPKDLILPLFVTESDASEIVGMPGIFYNKLSNLPNIIDKALEHGIKAVLLFPIVPEVLKTESGQHAIDPNNLIARAIKLIKQKLPEICIIADVALDPYTSHGHDGIIDKNGKILNDPTNEILAKQALMLADFGADVVAPSDMMDGRVGQIRKALEVNGFSDTIILSYAAKYNSKLYAPFRSALGSKQSLGVKDKSSYQQDIRNSHEALHEIAMDLSEGADWIMIKPGMQNLDIVYRAANEFMVPIAAYQVSGEYSMLAEFANMHQIDFMSLQIEALFALKRAGAMQVVCYNAIDIAKNIRL